jgi:feruloyl-CoA synthase
LRNLREIPTTAYFNVPKGYEMLLPALRADAAFRDVFFRKLHMLFYAAAGLRQQVADEMEALAIQTCGEPVPWVTGLGSTETAPFAMCTGPMTVPVAGHVGVPVPGLELKATPIGDVFEARVRGPNVMPGYWRDVDLTAAAFDEEGFLLMGDALGLVDPTDPSQGFMFLGRLLEDFKLSTGTWVRVGPLRTALLARFGELVQDVAIAGHDRDDIRILIFPQLATCRRLAQALPDASTRHVLESPAVMKRFAAVLREFAAARTGSATRVEHALLLETPPSFDAAEVTDKGTLNQKAVLRHRAAAVQQLYGEAPSNGLVIDVSSARPGDREKEP